ncbi:MAG: caspase family protein [Paramuribaculum sp.]|nr:caspase family protein [Paramuribaculum sp.]
MAISNRLLIFLVVIISSFCSQAQTMHAIIFSDTNDEKIGEHMNGARQDMKQQVTEIANSIGHKLLIYDYYGQYCSKKRLYSFLSKFNPASDDIVMFVYLGHGSRAKNDRKDPFPQMCLGTNLESNYVPVQYLVNQLSMKRPRLLVAFTNCCNREQEFVSVKPHYNRPKTSVVDREAYRKLFCDNRGQVVMTSSVPGQLSWGAVFMEEAIEALKSVGYKEINPTWADVLAKIKENTSKRDIHPADPAYGNIVHQTPHYVNRVYPAAVGIKK